MRLNVPAFNPLRTHEGAVAHPINALQQLRRSVLACFLWEDEFYESGQEIAERIGELCKHVSAIELSALAIQARGEFNLRHVPLLLGAYLAQLHRGNSIVSATIAQIIQRADELGEFCAVVAHINGKPLKKCLSAQAKKGLARAFEKFDAYALAKYNRDSKIKLRDVAFLCHVKPKDMLQATAIARLVNKSFFPDLTKSAKFPVKSEIHLTTYQKLDAPDTWEVALSGGAAPKETFERLMSEHKLGGLAFLRNLRKMQQAGVSKDAVAEYSQAVRLDRILPFRFIAAARAVPVWEDIIEPMMFRALEKHEKLSGRTILVVDNSGSMHGAKLSSKSDLDRSDAACALAILLREVCQEGAIISFSDTAVGVAPRRGFALADAIKRATQPGGTDTQRAILGANMNQHDRIIVITDEQSHTTIPAPIAKHAYFINVASAKNGIGYGRWTHIDGFSEAIISWLREFEASKLGE